MLRRTGLPFPRLNPGPKRLRGRSQRSSPGFRSAMLIRSEADSRRFESFSDWDDAQSRAEWEGSDGFRERMGLVRELCDDVQAGNFQLAASFSST